VNNIGDSKFARVFAKELSILRKYNKPKKIVNAEISPFKGDLILTFIDGLKKIIKNNNPGTSFFNNTKEKDPIQKARENFVWMVKSGQRI
jgi:hypothetical protein